MVVMIAYQPLSLKGLMPHPVIRGHRSILILAWILLLIQLVHAVCSCLLLASMPTSSPEMIEVLSNPQLSCPFLCPFRFLSLNCSGTSEFQAGRTLEVGKGFFDHSGMLPGPRKKASSGHWACTHWMLLTRPLARDSVCLCNLQGRWCYSYFREETGVQRLRNLLGPSS